MGIHYWCDQEHSTEVCRLCTVYIDFICLQLCTVQVFARSDGFCNFVFAFEYFLSATSYVHCIVEAKIVLFTHFFKYDYALLCRWHAVSEQSRTLFPMGCFYIWLQNILYTSTYDSSYVKGAVHPKNKNSAINFLSPSCLFNVIWTFVVNKKFWSLTPKRVLQDSLKQCVLFKNVDKLLHTVCLA